MFEIQNLIYIYMALCLAMMIFNLVYMIYNNSSTKNIQKRNKSIMKKIDMQITLLKSNCHVSARHKKYLEKKLLKVSNLYMLEETLKIYPKKYVEEYIEEVSSVITGLCKEYLKKNTLSKAYLAHFIANYEIGYKKDVVAVTNYLFNLLDSEDLYCIDNAMTALYKIGNLKDVKKAIKIIDKKESYQNIDMIVKGLLLYNGNPQVLAECLWEEFNTYSDKLKIAIIEYITIISDNDWNDEMLELLIISNVKKEVKMAVMNYFVKNQDERIREVLYKLVETTNIREADYLVIAIRALRNYPGEKTVAILKKMLQKNQWNVQVEASKTLKYLDVDYFQLADIYNGENQKARNILRYVIKK